MKAIIFLPVLLAIPLAADTIVPAQKEESAAAQQPAISVSFNVAANNAQDAHSQNSTQTVATQTHDAPKSQIIVIKSEQTSATRNILNSLFAAGLQVGVALVTSGQVKIPFPKTVAIFSRTPIKPESIARLHELAAKAAQRK